MDIFYVLWDLSQEHPNPEGDRSRFFHLLNQQERGVESKEFGSRYNLFLRAT